MFEQEIVDQVKALYAELKSFDEIERRTGVSKSVLARIYSGERPVKNPSIDFLMKMFPGTKIELHSVGSLNINTANGAYSSATQNFFRNPENDKLNRLKDSLMLSDLDAECKVKVYQLIQNLN